MANKKYILNDNEILEIIDVYSNKQMTMQKLSELFSVPRHVIANYLKQNGVFSVRNKNKQNPFNVDINEIINLYYNHNFTLNEIAKQYNARNTYQLY